MKYLSVLILAINGFWGFAGISKADTVIGNFDFEQFSYAPYSGTYYITDIESSVNPIKYITQTIQAPSNANELIKLEIYSYTLEGGNYVSIDGLNKYAEASDSGYFFNDTHGAMNFAINKPVIGGQVISFDFRSMGFAFENLGFATAGLQAYLRVVSQTIDCSNCNVTGGYDGENIGSLVLRATFSTTNPAPVSEPESYALMLAGLGLIGFAARRKQI